MMKWTEIDPTLAKQAAEAAGYTVVYSGIVSGWGARSPALDDARWGFNTEEEGWAEAFRWMCEREPVYRHKKGGIYVTLMTGKLTFEGVDWAEGSEAMVYRHLAPHDVGVWIRPLAEFNEEGRFVRVEG